MAGPDYDEMVNRLGAEMAQRVLNVLAPMLQAARGDLTSIAARLSTLEGVNMRNADEILKTVTAATSVQRSVLNALEGLIADRAADRQAIVDLQSALKEKTDAALHPIIDEKVEAALADLDASTAALEERKTTIAAAVVTGTAAASTESPGVVTDPPPPPPAEPAPEVKPSDDPAHDEPADETPAEEGQGTPETT